jgi:hypothetical protein
LGTLTSTNTTGEHAMNDVRTARVLFGIGVVHAITFGFLTVAAANDPHRFQPGHAPAAVVADTTDRPIAWRHG